MPRSKQGNDHILIDREVGREHESVEAIYRRG